MHLGDGFSIYYSNKTIERFCSYMFVFCSYMCTARLKILNNLASTGFLFSSYTLRKKVAYVPNYILRICLDGLGDLYYMTKKESGIYA